MPWVVFVYRFHSTSATTTCPLGGLYVQVPLCINCYIVSLGWSLYTGSTPYVQYVPIVVLCIVPMLTYLHTCTCIHTQLTHITLCVLYSVLTHWTCYNLAPNFVSSLLRNSWHVPPLKELASQLNILHLILSLFGTLDSKHKCIEIPYPQAFKYLLVGKLKP